MPDDYDHKMSDLEFQKFNLKQTAEMAEQEAEKQTFIKAGLVDNADEFGIGVLVEDDFEVNGADDEDNYSLGSADTDDDSLSLTGKRSQNSDDEQEF